MVELLRGTGYSQRSARATFQGQKQAHAPSTWPKSVAICSLNQFLWSDHDLSRDRSAEHSRCNVSRTG
jgi:hypothetical protein